MKKIILTLILLLGISVNTSACPLCDRKVMDGIYNSQFYPNLLTMLSAFIVLAIIVVVLTLMSVKKHKTKRAANPDVQILSPVPLTTASMILGIGLGGFMDGIVFHQILQAHAMLSNKISTLDYTGKSVNMFWDGIFHFTTLIVVIVGVILLWKLLFRKDIDRSGKLLGGGLFMGWGLFNIVEGVINHHIIQLHNVIELSLNHDLGNYVFLGVSVVLLILGYVIVNHRSKITYSKQENVM